MVLADAQVDPSTGLPDHIYWPLTDNLSTVRDLAEYDEQTGITSVVNHIQYDAFGTVTSETNAAVDTIFGFTGRESDEESDLYYYRARYYDPHLGQFASEDPLGFEAKDPNLRRYVGNGPVDAMDPSGLEELAWSNTSTMQCHQGIQNEDHLPRFPLSSLATSNMTPEQRAHQKELQEVQETCNRQRGLMQQMAVRMIYGENTEYRQFQRNPQEVEVGPAIGAPTNMEQFNWDMKWQRYHELERKARGYGWQGMTTEETEEYQTLAMQYGYAARSEDQLRRGVGVIGQVVENLGTPFSGLGNIDDLLFPFGGMTAGTAPLGISVPEIPRLETAWGHPIEAIPKDGTINPEFVAPTTNTGRLRDPKTGRFISDPANPPSPYKFTDAQRRAEWKRLAQDPNSPLTPAQRAEIEARGWRGPQRANEFGELETMELSHEPIPLREGGTNVVPRWPAEHAAIDPHRQLKKRP